MANEMHDYPRPPYAINPDAPEEGMDYESNAPATTCECSEEYGPCEQHCTVLAQREGASTRTADALALVFLMDVRDIIAHEIETESEYSFARFLDRPSSADDVAKLTRDIDEALSWSWSGSDAGDGWLDSDFDANSYTTSEQLQDMVQEAESMLGRYNASTWWEDGYVISRMSDDCPLRLDYAYSDDLSDDDYDGSFLCDQCGRIGTADDGCETDGECPDEECNGTTRRYDPASHAAAQEAYEAASAEYRREG